MAYWKNKKRVRTMSKAMGYPVRYGMHYASPYPGCGMNFGSHSCGCGMGPHGRHGPGCGCPLRTGGVRFGG